MKVELEEANAARVCEGAVRTGRPLLITNVQTHFAPWLTPLLSKAYTVTPEGLCACVGFLCVFFSLNQLAAEHTHAHTNAHVCKCM